MQERTPRPRRGRPRRRPAQRPRPTQAPPGPQPQRAAPARGRERDRPEARRPDRRERGGQRRGRGRQAPAERFGTPALILLDNREGEPDLTGAAAVFEGYFDPDSGERRRPGEGLPRLRVGSDRVWGFECWWRADPAGAGLVPDDHAAIEASKKLLRGLIRDARRPPAFARKSAT